LKSKDENNKRAWEPTKAELAISTIGGILFFVEIIITLIFFQQVKQSLHTLGFSYYG
jgi:hypothetical protein